MSIFGAIKAAIFGAHAPKAAPAAVTTPAAAAPHPAAVPAAPVQPAPAQPVDVEAILADMAAKAGKPSNWRVSIVDLLTLLGLDSNLAARKELAGELNVHAGDHGSAEQNIALHKAVMKALAANGGKVPASLQD